MKENKLNGSADLLAQAIRQVFEEATENGRMAVKEDMQVQFAEQEKKIAGMVGG